MAPRLAPELASGFEEIDGQHRELLRRVDLAIAAAQSDDGAATRDALRELGDYLMAHFAAEEAFMEDAGYPERGRHKSAHDLFMQDFHQLVAELAMAGPSVPTVQWITVRVPEWIKFHVQVNDLPLGQFLTAKHYRPAAQTGRPDKRSPS
jgi:hemerythrin